MEKLKILLLPMFNITYLCPYIVSETENTPSSFHSFLLYFCLFICSCYIILELNFICDSNNLNFIGSRLCLHFNSCYKYLLLCFGFKIGYIGLHLFQIITCRKSSYKQLFTVLYFRGYCSTGK